VTDDPTITARDLQQQLAQSGTAVHKSTVQRTLHRHGFKGRVARKKPLLKQQHRNARLQFAISHLDQPGTFWQRVLWTDETKIELLAGLGNRYVWRKKNAAFAEQNLVPTVKHGGGSIMLWGCFSAAGTGNLVRINGIMDSIKYQEILAQNLQVSAQALGLGRKWTFQQDNDPKHTSHSTRSWMQQQHLKVLEWPSQSPDLNPIENLWWDLKRAVRARKPTNLNDLERFCVEEWARIPQERCEKLVSSYKNRLLAVVAAKGGATKY
jgi:hypothetical protein